MKSIPLFFFFLFKITFINAEIDCSIYLNDLHMVNLNPFYVRPSLDSRWTSFNYGKPSQQIISLNIINDKNPSLSIYCLKNLQTLLLVNTNLTILTDIKNFQNLSSLTIRTDNGIIDKHLPSELGQLKAFKQLELNDIKNLEDLPDEIQYLTELNSLTLQTIPNFKKISDESIVKLTKLSSLNLIDLPISTLPTTINKFDSLKQFKISKTNITSIQLESLYNLTNLEITYNSLLETVEINRLVNMTYLTIKNNDALSTLKLRDLLLLTSITFNSNFNLTSLDIFNTPVLQNLYLDDAKLLKTIKLKTASSLSTIQFISSLNLESVTFENLPLLNSVKVITSPLLKTILFYDVPSINTIDLTGCQLKTFPESLLTLKSLTTLTLTSNQLSSLPSTLSDDLPNLKILYLVNNNFQGNIFQTPLIYIRELYLNNNTFTSIDGIGEYKSLQQLEMNFNQISTIPLEILKLTSILTKLSFNNNQLFKGVPYQLANMRSLTSLSLGNNYISPTERQNLLRLFQSTPIQAFIY